MILRTEEYDTVPVLMVEAIIKDPSFSECIWTVTFDQYTWDCFLQFVPEWRVRLIQVDQNGNETGEVATVSWDSVAEVVFA